MLSMQDVKKDADALKSVKKQKPIDEFVLVLSNLIAYSAMYTCLYMSEDAG